MTPESGEPASDARRGWRAEVVELAVSSLLFAAGVALYLGPSIGSIRGRLGPDLGDPRLNLYFVSWVAHALDSGLVGLWSPPFFFPTRGALAFSDHLIGPGFAVWLAGMAGIGRVSAFNLLFLASFVLSGTTAFWLFRRLRLDLWPALLGGWFVAFSHLRWDEISHYQVLRAQWIPVVLWLFDRFLARPRAASLAAFLGAYLLHVSGGSYMTYMIHVPMAVIVLFRLRAIGWRAAWRPPRRYWRYWLIGGGAATLAMLAPFVAGYVAEWGSRTIARQLWEVRAAGAVTAALVSPSNDALVRSLGLFAHGSERGALFPGFVLLAGCLVFAVVHLRPVTDAPRRRLAGLLALAAAGTAIALWGLLLADAYTLDQRQAEWLVALGGRRYNGPRIVALLGLLLVGLAAHAWPRRRANGGGERDPFVPALLASGAICLWLSLPVGYTTVHRILPGMSGMRVSHRFFAFTLVALAYLGAAGLQQLVRAVGSRAPRVALMALLSLAAFAEASPRRWEWVSVPERKEEFPAYAKFLAASDDVTAYVEYPIYLDYRDTEWMYLQTLHWKPLVNGYSARIASSYVGIADLFDPMPDAAGLAGMRAAGISHLAVHWPVTRSDRQLLRAPLAAATARGELERVFDGGGVAVYRLAAKPAP